VRMGVFVREAPHPFGQSAAGPDRKPAVQSGVP
jgi:hypothetical protein